MGKVIHIGGERHEYEVKDTPLMPMTYVGDSGHEHTIPLNELVLGADLPYEDAFWKRQLLPRYYEKYRPVEVNSAGELVGTVMFAEETVWEGNDLISLDEKDSNHFIYLFDREMYRRRNGVHFKNGNEIEYITGDHYAFLQWIKPYGLTPKLIPKWRPVGYEYAEYREFQRDVFYLIDKVNNDEDILGLYVAKPKKTGITQCFAAYFLNKATINRMNQMGIMSKGEDATTVNMLMVFHGFDGLPPVFQPNIKNRADRKGDLFFGEQPLRNVRTKSGQQRRKQLMDAKPLNTRIWAAKTKAAGFDSPTMTDIWFDELPKYDTENNLDPEVVFSRNQETVKFQDIYNGRIWITSYPPETDSRGFIQARKIYYDSKLSTIDKKSGGKRTRTGLIVHYISAVLSYTSTFDKYGKCNEKEAHRRNQEERQKVANDKKAYQAKVRQYSETERECWASSGAGSTFDNIRLGILLEDVQEMLRAGNRPYVDGRLEWTNTLWEAGAKNRRPLRAFCPVKFIPLTDDEIMKGTEGRIRIYLMPPPQERNIPLRMGFDQYKNLNPLPHFRNYGGADPTEYAAGTEVIQGSKNASYTMNFPDLRTNQQHGRIASNVIMSEYFYRPDNPHEFYEDQVKEIIFFGKRVCIEANKAYVATRLIQDGLGHYMIVKKRETQELVPWTPRMEFDKSYALVRTNSSGRSEELETIVRIISQFIIKPDTDEEPDYGAQIQTERLLDQLTNFTKERSNVYDLVMAWGYCLMCGEAMMNAPIVPTDNNYDAAVINAVYAALAG